MRFDSRLTAVIVAMASASASQATLSTTFQITDLRFSNDSLNGNPYNVTRYGSATFEWDYQPGAFADGTGHLLTLNVPFADYNWKNGVSTVDLSGVTASQSGNTHNTSFDLEVNFAPGLNGPTSSTSVTGGLYDFTGTDSFAGGEFVGSITGGKVSPLATPEPVSLSVFGLGLVGLLRRKRK